MRSHGSSWALKSRNAVSQRRFSLIGRLSPGLKMRWNVERRNRRDPYQQHISASSFILAGTRAVRPSRLRMVMLFSC